MVNSALRIGFIGAGHTGTILAHGLNQAGFLVGAVASRSYKSAETLANKISGCTAHTAPAKVVDECDIVFLTVPDDAITHLASSLPWQESKCAVHCSGALTSDALSPAKKLGAMTGSFHPLQTFSSLDTHMDRLTGCTFAIAGDAWLVTWLNELTKDFKGTAAHIEERDRPLYHASAVMACGYLTTLVYAASSLWKDMGFSRSEALHALLPLVKSTISNLEDQHTQNMATGPIIRGDLGTVTSHLEIIQSQKAEVLQMYAQLGTSMTQLAQEQGSITSEVAAKFRELFEKYSDGKLMPKKSKCSAGE